MTTASYYLWKWADNDLSGPPKEVFADLLRGKMHPALQPFDSRPLLRDLQALVAERHALGEEWEWQIMPAATPGHAHSIFLQCPTIPKVGSYCKQLASLGYKWSLSGFDEQRGTILDCLLPKKTRFILWWYLDDAEEKYDISEADLPKLLRRLKPEHHAIFENRLNHSVTCSACHNGFKVEWREYHHDALTNSATSDHWRAGNPMPPGKKPKYWIESEERVGGDWEWHTIRVRKYENELLRFDDAVLIFKTFLRSQPRPAQYQWRSLRKELDQVK